MSSKNENTDLKMLAGLGVVGLVLLVLGPVVWLAWSIMSRAPETEAPAIPAQTAPGPVGALGELDSTCGGPSRLPCRPGLRCSTGMDFSKSGTCVKDEAAAPEGTAKPEAKLQLGETCGTELCAPGLFCSRQDDAGSTGVCRMSDAQAPNILKFKLVGAEPSAGSYVAAAGTTIYLEVSTVNADKATAYFIPEDPSRDRVAIALKKGQAGEYRSEKGFKAEKGMKGNFQVRVDNGPSYAALDLAFATSD